MWLNLVHLIHHGVPDRKGSALPTDVTSGTYDLEDLDPGLGGNLIEGKVALDKTFGHLTYGCLTCCGYTPYLMLDPTLVGVGQNGGINPYGTNNCTASSGFSLSSYFQQTNARWWSGNTAVATVTSFNGHGVAAGTTNGFATANVPSGDGAYPKNPCPQPTQEGTNNVKVKPQITSPNTVWWFNGQTPSGYSTSITLTASGGSAYSWSITSGSNMITLSGTTGSSVTASSTGTAFSSTTTDIAVTVTDTPSGQSSAPFYITSRRPYRLLLGAITYQCDSQYGYSDLFPYTIQDQMGALLPSITTPFNENWTTPVGNNYPNNNWQRYNPQPGLTSDSEFTDQIQGAPSGSTPPTACPSAGQAVDHWGQEWFVGDLYPLGGGAAVQTDTIQKYTNHAEVQSITSPVP
jgi:hypothetical protein